MGDYFYRDEAEEFSFYRVPKILMKDERYAGLSTDAKLLYGLCLDRMSLSRKNGWCDRSGRVFIYYTLDNIQEDIGCALQKSVKLLKELEKAGLIERKRYGQGRPTEIYLKDFVHHPESKDKTYENHSSGIMETIGQDLRKSKGSNTEKNNTELSNTDPIYPDAMDRMDQDTAPQRDQYRDYFSEALSIDELKAEHPLEAREIDEIFELILDTVCTSRKKIYVAGEERPAEVVRGRFMQLSADHITYVMGCLKANPSEVHNIRQYLLTALYYAPTTIDNYYSAQVRHDMADINEGNTDDGKR